MTYALSAHELLYTKYLYDSSHKHNGKNGTTLLSESFKIIIPVSHHFNTIPVTVYKYVYLILLFGSKYH